jgi:hypothetical protein
MLSFFDLNYTYQEKMENIEKELIDIRKELSEIKGLYK